MPEKEWRGERVRQLWAIIKKEFIQIRRDPRTLGIILFAPMMMLILYGYAVNFDIRHIGVVVYDEDSSQQSRKLVKELCSSEYFDLLGYSDSSAALIKYLDSGRHEPLSGYRPGSAGNWRPGEAAIFF